MGTTSKCHFSLRLPNESFKIETLIIPKLWTFIYILNKIYFEDKREISLIWKNDFWDGFVLELEINSIKIARILYHIVL
jgi:hypothetical protein